MNEIIVLFYSQTKHRTATTERPLNAYTAKTVTECQRRSNCAQPFILGVISSLRVSVCKRKDVKIEKRKKMFLRKFVANRTTFMVVYLKLNRN